MKITNCMLMPNSENSPFSFVMMIILNVVELLHGNSGLSWFLSKNGVKVASPMDFKAGYNFSTMKGQDVIWQQLERLQPHCIVINNPSPKQEQSFYLVAML